ncbi:MAG TPA: PP2C family protein-serine/threonine phosphatase [Anaeromyxobacteraceae bacterium]|nr:PP2C family protein-serine/threonine phosphatase [Anaeromyxobacteraceae bacterium]
MFAGARGAEPAGFKAYCDGLIHSWSATVGALALAINPLFLALDSFTMPPELLSRFAVYRAVVTGATLVQFLVIRKTRPTRWSFLHGYVTTALFAVMISKMTVDLGGFDSPYHEGLQLVIVGVSVLLPWRALHAAINAVAVVAVYTALNALYGGPFHLPTLVANLYFLCSTAVISVAISYARHRLIRNEYALRAELEEANANLDRSRHELRAARDALWGEMEVAKRIQTALLPENRRIGAYEVAARMLPAAEVGGDYYDIIELPEGDRSWIAIGDVSGHGVESGLVMMMTQTSILSLARENRELSPAAVFRAVNGVLNENISRLRTARYMTLNLVQLAEDGLLVAGKHQDVLVWRRATAEVETVSNEGCWIGVVDDVGANVTDQLIRMEEGDVALFYTDGATEAMRADGEMYGDRRLAEALARVAVTPLDDGLAALFAEIAAFQERQDDDITLMLVRKTRDAAALAHRAPGARSSAA